MGSKELQENFLGRVFRVGSIPKHSEGQSKDHVPMTTNCRVKDLAFTVMPASSADHGCLPIILVSPHRLAPRYSEVSREGDPAVPYFLWEKQGVREEKESRGSSAAFFGRQPWPWPAGGQEFAG